MQTTTLFRSSTDFKTFKQGDVVFETGDLGDCMYVVKEGEISLFRGDKELSTLGTGEIFGEMAIIDSQPRSASAIAKTDCQLIPINEKKFGFLVQQTPNFALFVMRVLAERLRTMDCLV